MRSDATGPILFHLLTAAAAACVSTSIASDWPTFRGADRSAVAPDTDLLESWPADGPALGWQAAGAGRGYASLAIAGDRIYTLGDGLSTASDTDEYLTCFDRATGKQIWKTKTGQPWTDGQESWQSSRSTPTVDGERVYVITPHGQLVACRTDNGTELFRIDLKAQFGGTKGDSWGYSESVTIDGDRLVCTPGGEKASMVALDKKTGRTIWTCPMKLDRGAGHASIVTSTVQGTRVYVQTTASGAFAVEAQTGRFLWAYPIDQTTAVIPTPIVKDDLVFFSAGYKRGGALVRQVAGPGGAVRFEEVYGLKQELANKHGGIVLVGDHLYGCADDQPILVCAELQTGKIVWKERGSGKGSATVVAADGHVYVRYADGTVSLVRADPAAYREVSSFKTPGSGDRPSWAHMVILDGMLYLREGDAILCYDVRAR
ncbi:MAG: PQQ-binding-like beta-propeller repeat protein [Planctomycetia bacterium]